jgi:hypothetical protein
MIATTEKRFDEPAAGQVKSVVERISGVTEEKKRG